MAAGFPLFVCNTNINASQISFVPLLQCFYSLASLDPLELGSMLLSYTRQIALGMVYLMFKSYVHRDLAARNILVSQDGMICKV